MHRLCMPWLHAPAVHDLARTLANSRERSSPLPARLHLYLIAIECVPHQVKPSAGLLPNVGSSEEQQAEDDERSKQQQHAREERLLRLFRGKGHRGRHRVARHRHGWHQRWHARHGKDELQPQN